MCKQFVFEQVVAGKIAHECIFFENDTVPKT